METTTGAGAPQVKVAGAEQAVQWVKEGWEIFKKAPGIWIAIFIIYLVLAAVANWIPVLGSLAMSLLAPVFTVGMMLGIRELLEGRELVIGHLFAGFQSPRLNNLVVLGLLSLALWLGIGLVAGLGVAGLFFHGGQFSADDIAHIGIGAALLGLVILLLIFLIASAFLFAAPLVGLRGMPPVDAVKLSFAAAFQNWLPLLVWSVLALLLFIAGSIPFGLGLLVVIPMMAASYYCAYRDIFGDA